MTALCACPGVLIQFTNCRILRDHSIVRDDLWIRDGKIQNPEKIFFDERALANVRIDCQDAIIAPGFIDTQINGAFGVDFSDPQDVAAGVVKVAQGLLSQGVTSFCPTVITSPPHVYKEILPHIKRTKGSKQGASVLGVHLEGPFISREKKGAHPEQCIRAFPSGFQDVLDIYGNIDHVAIVTLAPELPRSEEVIRELTSRGVVVSLGHSIANLVQGEEAVHHGATYITHLFNAMLPFHHRDPHLVGLLASDRTPPGRTVFFGLISDGIHTHSSALRIAHRVHPAGLVLVTDAIRPMGLPDGCYNFGQQAIEVCGKRAVVAGTDTLCGSIANMDKCVQHFAEATDCGAVMALEAASLHAAQVLGLQEQKGTLDFGSDADLIWLNDALEVQATFVGGQLAWSSETAGPLLAAYPL